VNSHVRLGSIGARLGLALAVVAVLVFAVVGFLLHAVLAQVLVADEKADLLGKTQVVQRFVDEVRSGDDLPLLQRHLEATSVGGRFRWNVWVIRPDGTILYGAEPLPPTVQRDGNKLQLRRQDGVELRGTSYALDGSNPVLSNAQVLIGMDPRPRAEMLARYDRLSIVVCTLGVLASAGLSLLAMRRGLSPVRKLSDEAARIQPGAHLERLTLPRKSAELLPLAQRFNEVLERMESAWTQLEGFNANVAHELRTPLAILINGAELALARDRPPHEMRDVIESHLEELRALASMVNDMLFLARVDRGETPDNLERISVHDEAASVGDFVEALLAEKYQRLVVTGDALLLANRSLVRRALVNLLTNGSRHAPEGSELVVQIAADPEVVRVVVRNPGPPIPDEVQQRMFDRFWRGENSRAKSGERFGLGLAIVRAIARMHGGDASVQCIDGHNQIGFTLRQ
jgi:two-component system heavy metal sensor histidine kinase CusS